MEHSDPNSGRRERRKKLRLTDVHRIVDKVLPKHMPDKNVKPPNTGERRGGSGPRKS